jgi:hypothetical protein
MDGTSRTNMNGLYAVPSPWPNPAFIHRSTTVGGGLRDLIPAICARLAVGDRNSPGGGWERSLGPGLGLMAPPHRPSSERSMGVSGELSYNFRQIDLLRWRELRTLSVLQRPRRLLGGAVTCMDLIWKACWTYSSRGLDFDKKNCPQALFLTNLLPL